MSSRSLWPETAGPDAFAPLAANVETDVVVIGGGITGLTAAVLLRARRRPGYLFTEDPEAVESQLRREYEAAKRAGLPVELQARAVLPFENRGAVRFPDQAQMHAGRYTAALARAATNGGAAIHENSRVITVEDGEPCTVYVESGTVVRAKNVFVATHAPLNRVFLQTKIHAYRSYVHAYSDIELTDGLFWDTADPYHYFSVFTVDGKSYLIIGGEDHKTGAETDTDQHFSALHDWTRTRLPVSAPALSWSAQVEEPVEGLPYIGRNSASENVYVDFPMHFVSDHVRPAEVGSLDETAHVTARASTSTAASSMGLRHVPSRK